MHSFVRNEVAQVRSEVCFAWERLVTEEMGDKNKTLAYVLDNFRFLGCVRTNAAKIAWSTYGDYTDLIMMRACSHLHSRLWKVDFQCDFLPHENIRISSFLEECLENVELSPCERRSFASLFTRTAFKYYKWNITDSVNGEAVDTFSTK